jgi:hypothetical protein
MPEMVAYIIVLTKSLIRVQPSGHVSMPGNILGATGDRDLCQEEMKRQVVTAV